MLTVLATLESVMSVVKTVLGIGGLIFVHELGHFLVGRWCGVRAEVFSIGFGPALWKWQPGSTEYRIAPVPLGGYVKFLGESPDEATTAKDSFLAATYPRKAAILLAGVTMNVIAAFALFVWTFSVGVELPAPVVGAVEVGSPAWEHGIRRGDEVVAIDGARILEFKDIVQDVILADAVDVTLRRDGELLPTLHVPTREGSDGLHHLGLRPAFDDSPVVQVVEDSPAAKAGLTSGDRLVAFAGEPVASAGEAEAAWQAAGGGTFTVERDGVRRDVRVPAATQKLPRIGIVLDGLTVGALQKGGPAARAGLRVGDRPTAVDGDPVIGVSALQMRLTDDAATAPRTLTVRRQGQSVDVAIGDDPAAFAASFTYREDGLVCSPYAASGESRARAAGLTAGSLLLTADGRPIRTLDDLHPIIAAAADRDAVVQLRWRDAGGAEHEAGVRPSIEDAPVALGLAAPVRTHLVKEPDVVAAIGLGIQRTHRWVKRILGTLGSLVTGEVSATNLSGPVAIVQHTYRQAETGLGQFLLFLGFISMNLAVLNLLPIPMLDGGQLAMVSAERIRGRPLPESVQAGLQWAGLILLLGLMVFVVANDIRNL